MDVLTQSLRVEHLPKRQLSIGDEDEGGLTVRIV